jgi:hypothetical protein
MKAWLIIFLAALLLFGVGGAYTCLFSAASPILVVGSLPANDLADIKRVVRIEIATARLGSSWRKVWRIPSAVKYYQAHPIVRMEAQDNNTVEVLYRATQLSGDIGYVLRRGTNGWKITGTLFQ